MQARAQAVGQPEGSTCAEPPPPGHRHAGRWAVGAVIAVFLALLVYGLVSKGTDDRIDRALSAGRAPTAPDFTLEVLERGTLPQRLAPRLRRSLGDERLGLVELRGTPAVVNMWASWCTPCRAEAALLERGWRTWQGRGVAYLGLNIQDLRGDARAFLRDFGTSYPNVRDAGRDTADRYGATGIPETFFIDRRGRVVGHVIGAVSERQLSSGSSAALAGRVIGRSSGGASFDVR